jgi:hypothetical protein
MALSGLLALLLIYQSRWKRIGNGRGVLRRLRCARHAIHRNL